MTQIKQVNRPMYTTSDDKTFEDKNEAIGHQAVLNVADVIDQFIAETHPEARERGKLTMRKSLERWVAYKAVHDASKEVAEEK